MVHTATETECYISLLGNRQWGKVGNEPTIVRFGIAFTDNAYYVKSSMLNDNKSIYGDIDMQVVKLSKAEAEMYLQGFNSGTDSNYRGYLWIAVGR